MATTSPSPTGAQTTGSISSTSTQTQTQTQNTSTKSASQEVTIPITTTFTSSSQRCVATLEAQVLNDGATAVVMENGSFVTLNNTCHSIPSTMIIRPSNASLSGFPSASASYVSTQSQQSEISPGTIAGLVIGVVALIGCLVGAGFWLWYRRRRSTTVFTAKAKMLEEDRSGEVPIRWEKDSAEIKESDCAEIKEMSAGPLPVEMGDGRSIIETNDWTPLSPISIDTRDPRDTLYGEEVEGIVSPLSPKR